MWPPAAGQTGGTVIPEKSDQEREIIDWLTGEARLCGDAVEIIDGYVRRLRAAGSPISRARAGQRLANPLLAAWGVIWTLDGATLYTIPRITLDTDAWHGSPFEYVLTKKRPLHKSLLNLTADDHRTYHELAGEGGTDFYATALDYGDGSRQGCSFMTDSPSGFEAGHIELIENTRMALASAFEPLAMRRSMRSLLKTYLGLGPAEAVVHGTIERGQNVQRDAAIMFSDLRGFTARSVASSEKDLLSALDDYFEAVVEAVRRNSGDVLKFLGDGILAVFPADGSPREACENAVAAARDAIAGIAAKNLARSDKRLDTLAAGFGLSFGAVTYGNIGSPDRLDFTVVGAAVNRASRIQDICKTSGKPILLEDKVARHLGFKTDPVGPHTLRGLPGTVELYSVGEIA